MTVAALSKRSWVNTVAPPPDEPAQKLVRPARYGAARRSPQAIISDIGALSRAQGCLLGQVCGDALGGLVEFKDAGRARARYPDGCRDLIDGGTWDNLAGQPTDDSELALLLARTLVEKRSYDAKSVLEAYIDWWNDPRTYDRGNTIRQALAAAAKGKDHTERTSLIQFYANQGSQANGSLMRISPIGIFAAGRPDLAADLARQDSPFTHPNPVCGDSCAVFVAAIASAIASGGGSGGGPRVAYEAALEEAKRSDVSPSVRGALEAAQVAPPTDYTTQQGWVLIALQNAFYQLLHASSFEEGVVATVMSGGDTDTTAAIAGALLGAVHGRPSVPARWQRCVRSCRMLPNTPTAHPRAAEYWPVDVLELAECLLLAGG
jgi:ADP-ribosylglycohydrolase